MQKETERELVIALEISCAEVEDDVFLYFDSVTVSHPKKDDHSEVVKQALYYYSEQLVEAVVQKGQWTKPFKSDDSMFSDLFYMTTTATFNTESPNDWHSEIHAVVAEVVPDKEWKYGKNQEADKFLGRHLEAAKTFYKRNKK